MFNLALSLLSSLQMGARLKQTVERALRQAAILAVAAFLFLAALVFGLVAAFYALISVYDFSAAAAAGIMAAVLVGLGVLALILVNVVGREPKKRSESVLASPAQGIAMVDQGLGKAMQQVGPLTLVAVAFAAGLLVSRRR